MKTCAMVIGHKSSSPGASNKASGITEFDFNEKLAMDIEKITEGTKVQRGLSPDLRIIAKGY